jgi:virginiamycin B lyase
MFTARIARIAFAVAALTSLTALPSASSGAASPRWYVFTPGHGIPVYYSIVKTADNAMWIADNSSGDLSRLSPDGKHVKTFSLFPYHPEVMIVGPHGDFYINSLGSGAIAIVTQSGSFHTYPIPPGDYAHGGLAVGADGNVWFVEESHVGRITPDGVITLFPYIKFALANDGITPGPDGKLWFVGNTQHGIVGNIDPFTKKFMTYALLRAQWCYPHAIVSAPDGNLWFTCQHGGIGMITTTGSYRMFKLPGFNFAESPQCMVIGPDGQLWLSGGSGGGAELVRFDTRSHQLTTWKAPSYITQPGSITIDAEANVWGVTPSSQVIVFVRHSL